MIGFVEPIRIGQNLYGGSVIKPGYGDQKPPKPIQTYDPPDAMDKCLNCTASECNMKSEECKLNKKTGSKKAAEIAERDEKVLKLLKSGWINIDAICEEVGISRNTYFSTKKKLKRKGLI